MAVDDLCWDLLALLICLRYQGPAKDPFLQTQWYMWFLHIIAPVPVIALNALETPVNAFMAKRLQAALRSSGLQLSIWCDGYTAPMQCTPHKYIVTQGKSWKAVGVDPMPFGNLFVVKKLILQSWYMDICSLKLQHQPNLYCFHVTHPISWRDINFLRHKLF